MKKIAIVLALIGASGVAYAQQPGFYLGASVGQTNISTDDLVSNTVNELRAAGATSVSSDDSNRDVGWKIFGGYQFNPYLALEGGYVNFGKYDPQITGLAGTTSFKIKGQVDSDAMFFDVVGHLPVNESFSVFGKVGLAFTWTDASASGYVGNLFSASAKADENEVVPKLGVGVRYNITKQIGVRAEYEYYYNVGEEDTTGESSIRMGSVGMTYHF